MILDRLRLERRVALVTGAGSGLGRAMALALAEAGCTIAAAGGRRAEALDETRRLIEAQGGRCFARPADVTASAQVNAMVTDVLAALGQIDVLINNAGGADDVTGTPLAEITDEQWQHGMDVNFNSVFYCTRAVLPHMLERQHGRIISIASGWGLRGGRNNWTYAASKAAVIEFTKALAITHARDGIRANAIAPGFIPHMVSDEQRVNMNALQPYGRVGYAEEIGPLAVFLASEAADYVTGETIVLSGGAIAGGLLPAGVAPRTSAERAL